MGFLFRGRDLAAVVVLGVFTAVVDLSREHLHVRYKARGDSVAKHRTQSRGLGVFSPQLEFQRDPCILLATPDTHDDTRADLRNKSAYPAFDLGWWAGVRAKLVLEYY
ncbi:MAG: hypothetical protein WCA19_07190 [Candidatus Acidiferrales bacterium]